MAVQAVIDPEPVRLVANLACAPADVVWRNTYLSRASRMARAWSITLVIIVLTDLFSFVLIPLAYLLNLNAIRTVLPHLADLLERHEVVASLVRTSLPTLVISLMTVSVPYLYDCKFSFFAFQRSIAGPANSSD
jgi:calcium permeable stress-gated cation channel